MKGRRDDTVIGATPRPHRHRHQRHRLGPAASAAAPPPCIAVDADATEGAGTALQVAIATGPGVHASAAAAAAAATAAAPPPHDLCAPRAGTSGRSTTRRGTARTAGSRGRRTLRTLRHRHHPRRHHHPLRRTKTECVQVLEGLGITAHVTPCPLQLRCSRGGMRRWRRRTSGCGGSSRPSARSSTRCACHRVLPVAAAAAAVWAAGVACRRCCPLRPSWLRDHPHPRRPRTARGARSCSRGCDQTMLH